MSRTGKRALPPEADMGERWLLTYSDMITLLMALFMVLFSISSVNVSKYVSLQQSLRAAFSGAILTGGRSILQFGSSSTAHHSPSSTDVPSIVPLTPTIKQPGAMSAGSSGQIQQALAKEAQDASLENSDFQQLKYRLNSYARAHGFSNQVRAEIGPPGLVVTVLTDKLLFQSGQDALLPASYPLLTEIATLIDLDKEHHPVVVQGFTDNVPIHNSEFPSNWWLSSARANIVNQYLITHHVSSKRMSTAGYGDQHQVASNATSAGRARNRRVVIVFERKYPAARPNA